MADSRDYEKRLVGGKTRFIPKPGTQAHREATASIRAVFGLNMPKGKDPFSKKAVTARHDSAIKNAKTAKDRKFYEKAKADYLAGAPKSSKPSTASIMAYGGRGSGGPAPKTGGLAAWEKSAEMRLAEKKMRVATDLAESGAPQERVEQRLQEALEHAEKSGSEQAKKKAAKAAAEVRKKVLTRSGGPAGGGGGGDQPRAPAGGPDGGQWIKG